MLLFIVSSQRQNPARRASLARLQQSVKAWIALSQEKGKWVRFREGFEREDGDWTIFQAWGNSRLRGKQRRWRVEERCTSTEYSVLISLAWKIQELISLLSHHEYLPYADEDLGANFCTPTISYESRWRCGGPTSHGTGTLKKKKADGRIRLSRRYFRPIISFIW